MTFTAAWVDQVPVGGIAATPSYTGEDTADAVTAVVTMTMTEIPPVHCQTAVSTAGTSTCSGFI